MHANLSITDGVYGILSETDVREQIAQLGQKDILTNEKGISEIIFLLERLLHENNIANRS